MALLALTHRRPVRLPAILSLLAVCLFGSGYSSCAGTAGPLLVPLEITPTEVLLRASLTEGREAVGLARVVGGESGEQFQASVSYGKNPPAEWLAVDVAGNDLTLRARPGGLTEGVHVATVTVEGRISGATASLRVELTVTP